MKDRQARAGVEPGIPTRRPLSDPGDEDEGLNQSPSSSSRKHSRHLTHVSEAESMTWVAD